ncbi:MAG: LacI family transcriptional regulator, partial [Gammaproteobacteria bacterium]
MEYDPLREEQFIHDMLSWRPSGLVVCGLNQTQAARTLLERSAVPVAQMMDVDGESVGYNVGISHGEAGQAMVKHLLERG